MNEDLLKGKWTELKGELQKKWGELTDKDMERVKGNTQALIGLLQQKIGLAKDEATQNLKEVVKKLETKNSAVVDQVDELIDKAKQKLRRNSTPSPPF